MRKHEVKIGKHILGEGRPTLIVAEIANCHNGSFETAKLMVDKIADTGVDAVKFQLHIPSAEMIPSHPKFKTQTQRSLNPKQIAKLKKYVEDKRLLFICSAFSREAADELVKMGVSAIKIGSGEVSDLPLLEYVAKKGLPMIVSTGMTSWAEIKDAVRVMKKRHVPFVLLHCVSIYPNVYNKLNLRTIESLRKQFNVPVGWSDQVPEIYSAIGAMAFAPAIVEKHYTLDRNQPGTSDHKVSIEPAEFLEMVNAIRKLETAYGEKKGVLKEEKEVISWARHSVVSTRPIPRGKIISTSDISTKRPLNRGVPAKYFSKIIGKKSTRDIKKDTIIRWSDVS